GKNIFAPAAQGGRALTAENHFARKLCVELRILSWNGADARTLIIQSDEVHGPSKWIRRLRPVHCRRSRTSRIFFANYVAKFFGDSRAARERELFADFVADAPYDDG